eukprot:10507413-Lingulodinium_polyedra.AAC.1
MGRSTHVGPNLSQRPPEDILVVRFPIIDGARARARARCKRARRAILRTADARKTEIQRWAQRENKHTA